MQRTGKAVGDFDPVRVEHWAVWIYLRELIRKRRESGRPAPWLTAKDVPAGYESLSNRALTLDVMRNTRFCNVRRMDDKVSRWLIDRWYDPNLPPSDLVIAALMARMINKPETLTEINQGDPFNGFYHNLFLRRLQAIKDRGDTVFTSAYIINAAGGGSKIRYVMEGINNAYQAMQKSKLGAAVYLDATSMENTWQSLQSIQGVGSFIAGQVVADLRHVYRADVAGYWLDALTWAPPGPGSSKGMRYLLGNLGPSDLDGRGKDMRANEFLPHLQALVVLARKHRLTKPIFLDRGLEAHDIQNTLCETSKFVRVAHGGHAKNQYNWSAYATGQDTRDPQAH
jgi:hypothetical protein